MEGWIDRDLRHWKNLGGAIAELPTTADELPACPTCKVSHRDESLVRLSLRSFWRCSSGHTFECTMLANDERNYFF